MKKKVFCVMALCMGLFSSCDKEEIGFEEPIIPPIEEPEFPTPLPSTNDLIKVKIDDDIMAIIGNNHWYGIAYGNGKYVVVGASGYTTTSTDGVNWTTPKQISTNGINVWVDVVYGNGKYVTVGSGGYVSTSTDGINWTTPQKMRDNIQLAYIIYNDGKYIANGHDVISLSEWKTIVITSTDGVNWTTPIYALPMTSGGITYGNGKYVVVGNSGYTTTSTDCISWTEPANSGLHSNVAITYGNGKYVVAGYMWSVSTSTDGVNWTTPIQLKDNETGAILYNSWRRIIYINNQFVVFGDGGYVSTSTDGVNWTTPIQLKDENGITISNNIFGACAIFN